MPVRKGGAGPRHGGGRVRPGDRQLRVLAEVAELLAAPLELEKILRSAVGMIARAMGARIVSIMLLDERDGLFVLKASRGLPRGLRGTSHAAAGDGIVGWVARTGEPLLVPDLRADPRFSESPFADQYSTTSLLCVPILRAGRVAGVISVNNKRDGTHFTEDDLAWLSVLVRQAALLLEKAELHAHIAGERDRWRQLNELAATLMGTIDLAPLLRKVLRWSCRLLGATHASILLHDPESDVLRFAPAVGPGSAALREVSVRPGQGLAGWVFARREAVLVPDTAVDERFWPGADARTGLTTKTIMAVPLVVRDRALGVMEALNRRDGRPFGPGDLEFMQMIAAVVSIAIDNSLLYRSLTDFNHRLERTVRARTRDLARANRDLSRSLRAEESLRQFNAQIIDDLASGLITLDVAGGITSVNAPGLRILGRERLWEEPILADVLGEAAAGVLPALRGEGAPPRRGETTVLVGGEKRMLGYSVSPMRSSPDGRSRWIMVFQDLTETKRFEQTVRRLDQLVSLGEISASVAHELRNPLTAIFLNMFFFKEKAPPELRERVAIVINQMERMEGIIAQMGIPTRSSPAPSDPVDLCELLRQLVLFLDKTFRERRVRLDVELSKAPLLARGEGERLQQVFLNILMNAVQATPEGGRVSLRAARSGADRIEVVVADSGPGIPPGVLARIFEPFFTTKEQGTGLGLSISDRIVREQGGEISASNVDGEGACFRVVLPAAN